MSVIDKMKLLRERRTELYKSMDARAQQLLDRYAEADKKAEGAFAKHNSRLDAESVALGEVEAAIDQLGNEQAG